MKYHLSYPSALRLTPHDRHVIESGVESIRRGNRDGSPISGVGSQFGRSKYSITRAPWLKADPGEERFAMTIQRGVKQYQVAVTVQVEAAHF